MSDQKMVLSQGNKIKSHFTRLTAHCHQVMNSHSGICIVVSVTIESGAEYSL